MCVCVCVCVCVCWGWAEMELIIVIHERNLALNSDSAQNYKYVFSPHGVCISETSYLKTNIL